MVRCLVFYPRQPAFGCNQITQSTPYPRPNSSGMNTYVKRGEGGTPLSSTGSALAIAAPIDASSRVRRHNSFDLFRLRTLFANQVHPKRRIFPVFSCFRTLTK